jgi:hypothetical protein
MSRDTVADALDRAAEALAQAAHELRGTNQPEAGASAPSAPAPAARLPQRTAPKGKWLNPGDECPLHPGAILQQSNYGKGVYHGQKGDYCYGKVKPPQQGSTAPAPQDVDDIPF